MCKSPRASSAGNWQDASYSKCLETISTLTNYQKYLFFKLNASFRLTVTSILSPSIIFYNVYNHVIVIGSNYFVVWNDFHITV